MKQTNRPISTPIGELIGCRDIFPESITFNPVTGILEVLASVDGDGASSAPDSRKAYPFRIVFEGLLAFRVVELDSWESTYSFSPDGSNLDEVIGSDWLGSLIQGGKVRSNHRHFTLQTYDHVLDVICIEYNVEVKLE